MPEHGPASGPPAVDPIPDPTGLATKALRRTERWLLSASMLVLLAMLGIGWQWVRFSTPQLVRDGVLAMGEARFWVRSRDLRGLTVAQAQRTIDAPLEPVGKGMTAARAAIAPASPGDPPRWLILTLEAGRVTDTKVE